MLFGDLKTGGWLTVTVVDDNISLVAKPKLAKVPLLTAKEVLTSVFSVEDAD
jgi:hypothetical protein